MSRLLKLPLRLLVTPMHPSLISTLKGLPYLPKNLSEPVPLALIDPVGAVRMLLLSRWRASIQKGQP